MGESLHAIRNWKNPPPNKNASYKSEMKKKLHADKKWKKCHTSQIEYQNKYFRQTEYGIKVRILL